MAAARTALCVAGDEIDPGKWWYEIALLMQKLMPRQYRPQQLLSSHRRQRPNRRPQRLQRPR